MNKLIQKNLVENFKRKLRVGGQIPKLQTAWSGWYSTNDAAKEYANSLVEGVRQMKSEADQIRKATTTARKRDRTPSPAINNTAKLQATLFRLGAYKGEKNRKGQPLSFNDAVDGIFGDMSKRAVERAKAMGYTVDMQSGTVKKGGHTKISKNSKSSTVTTASSKTRSSSNGLASMRETTHAARTGGMSTIPINNSTSPVLEVNGHAIYLHYPNFIGNSKNAFEIGNFDPGEAIGNPQLPVGHAATILIDDEGNANYYEYGRFAPNNGNLIGTEQRASVKGGNWRQFKLPRQEAGENDSVYVSRIQKMLPDTKTGAYQAMTIPSVDVRRATEFIQNEANNKNRKEYGIFNTCATGACNATLNFRKNKLNNKKYADNRAGYSEAALNWSRLPFTTDSYATKAREAASKVYIMNN